MPRICQITGKTPSVGSSISHSHRKTKRRFIPNFVSKRIYNPETGRYEKMVVTAAALRTLQKRMK